MGLHAGERMFIVAAATEPAATESDAKPDAKPGAKPGAKRGPRVDFRLNSSLFPGEKGRG